MLYLTCSTNQDILFFFFYKKELNQNQINSSAVLKCHLQRTCLSLKESVSNTRLHFFELRSSTLFLLEVCSTEVFFKKLRFLLALSFLFVLIFSTLDMPATLGSGLQSLQSPPVVQSYI